MPERIVLVHAKSTRYAYFHDRIFHLVAVEKHLITGVMLVYALTAALRLVGVNLLAVVARKELVAVGELENLDGAFVLASRTHLEMRRILARFHKLVEGYGLVGGCIFLAGVECGAISSHHFGDVGIHHVHTRLQLQGTHYGEVAERSALHHDILTKFLYIL